MLPFEKPEINLTTPQNAKTSTEAQVAAWNEYYADVKEQELDPLFVQMREAKVAYFAAIAAVNNVAHDIMKEYGKLNEGLIRMYAPGADVKRTDITYGAHRSSYISENEVAKGKIIN